MDSWSESNDGLGTLDDDDDDDDIFEGPASCMFSTLIQISDARTLALTSLLASLQETGLIGKNASLSFLTSFLA